MAGEELLLGGLGTNDLVNFQNSLVQTNPYGLAGQAIGSAQFNTSTWTPAETAATSFGRAFLAGLLGRYAQQDAADQTNKLISVLPQLRSNPMAVMAPEGVDEGAFATIKANAVLKNYAAKEQEAQLEKKFNSDLLARLLGKKADVIGENEAYKDLGAAAEQIPGTPAHEANQNRIKAEQDAASMSDSLRKQFEGLPEVKNLKEVSTRFDTLKRGLLDKNAISDYEFAVNLAKIYDPTSVVREGESGQVIDSQSIPSAILGRINHSLQGGPALDAPTRLSLIASAKRNYDAQKTSFENVAEQYRGIAGTRKLDPAQVVLPVGSSYTLASDDLRELASRFPPTPEGRTAFKQSIELLK